MGEHLRSPPGKGTQEQAGPRLWRRSHKLGPRSYCLTPSRGGSGFTLGIHTGFFRATCQGEPILLSCGGCYAGSGYKNQATKKTAGDSRVYKGRALYVFTFCCVSDRLSLGITDALISGKSKPMQFNFNRRRTNI